MHMAPPRQYVIEPTQVRRILIELETSIIASIGNQPAPVALRIGILWGKIAAMVRYPDDPSEGTVAPNPMRDGIANGLIIELQATLKQAGIPHLSERISRDFWRLGATRFAH
jgi:hypothetical protein